MTDPAQPAPTLSLIERLRSLTPARIGLGRSGVSLTTQEVLGFQLAHAEARDAVHVPLDAQSFVTQIEALGQTVVRVESMATRRDHYLRRPDLGRKLDARSAARLDELGQSGPRLALVVADGLSSRAVAAHAAPTLRRLLPKLLALGLPLAPIVVAEGGRVALGDEIGERLGARLVVVLIGERPGLSSPDSLGAYITFAPRIGRADAERNCVSNIRAAGLAYEAASNKIAWLAAASLARGGGGVMLKDESEEAARFAIEEKDT